MLASGPWSTQVAWISFKVVCHHRKLINYKGAQEHKRSNLSVVKVGDEAIMNLSKPVMNFGSVHSYIAGWAHSTGFVPLAFSNTKKLKKKDGLLVLNSSHQEL